MEAKDHYKVLGVARDASADEIKRAFRKMARKYHPDVASGSEAEAHFKEINAAYDVLKDPEKRAEYDNPSPQGHPGGAGFQPPPDWESGFGFSHPGGGREEHFEDIFGTFFRDSARRSDRHAGMRAPDQHAKIELNIEDSYRGATRVLTFRSPQLAPDGSVQWEKRDVSVRIPKGVSEGQNIRLKGQGLSAAPGEPSSDLYIEVLFAPHPIFRAEGRDLYLDLPVTPWEAALGQKVVLPTPDGKVDLKLPENARSGQKMRLKGKGLPGEPPGDIYATLKIVNPKASTAEARQFFETMAREMPFNPRAGMGE